MPLHHDVATTETNFDVKASIAKNRWQGMWQLMRGYRPHYTGAIAALAIAALANTASSLLLRYLVDDVLISPPDNVLVILLLVALGFFVLTAIRGGFSFLSGALSAQTAEGLALRLKDYMFDHLQHLNFLYHDTMQTGELIQRSTSDIDAIRRLFAEQANGIGRIVLIFIVNFVALLALHWQLALVSVVIVPIVAATSIYFFGKVGRAYEAYQSQDEKLSAKLQENLSGVRVVKAFARQSYEVERFEVENKEKYNKGLVLLMLHATYWPITDVMTELQRAIGYLLGALLVINGGMTILGLYFPPMTLGTFVAYVAIIGWIMGPMRNLGRLIVQISEGLVSYDRLVEVMENNWEDIGKNDPAPIEDIRGNIVFEDINFSYETGPQVLHDINFEVQAGQTVALLGSTGSGKTTMMALLTRFYDYTDGSIKLEGVELNEYPRRFLRENIGVVEQEPFLFSRSIRENITYGLHGEVSDEQVFAAARAAAVHDVILSFPEGYQTLVGERGVTLSGGQKQRVALARTLLKNPKILLLDDAMSSVDTQTESEIRDALNNMMADRTSFIIAHRIQSVMTADLILVMDEGRIVQRGTHETLMLEDGIYRRTYDMQARIEDELEQELLHA